MNQFNDGSDNPFVRIAATLYCVASVALVIGGYLTIILTIPFCWIKLKTVTRGIERACLVANLVGSSMMVYGLLLTAVMFLTNAVWRTDFKDWWPTVSWILMDWNMSNAVSIGFDAMISFSLGAVIFFSSNFLGTYDEFGYDPPTWYIRRENLARIRLEYAQLKNQDPRRQEDFARQSKIDQVDAMYRWEKSMHRLEDDCRVWSRI